MAILKTDFQQFLDRAVTTLIGASDGGIRSMLYDVLSEFLNDSSIWTTDVTVAVTPNVTLYPVAVPEGQIIRLVGVADAANGFVAALMPTIGMLQLKMAPNAPAVYTATFVTNTALPTGKDMIPQAPDWLLPVWHVGILDGLLGNMMIQPNKSYSDKSNGEYHLKRFRDAIARARVSKLRANTNGSAAWRFPQQFRTTSQHNGLPGGAGTDRNF